MKSALRRASGLLTLRFVLSQFGLALLVLALSAAWLRLPDSGIAPVAATVMLALIIAVLAFLGEAALLRGLARPSSTRRGLVSGAIALMLVALLWFLMAAWLGHLTLSDSLRAGYLNSRFPHSMRNFFSFQHLLRALGWFWSALQWFTLGVLLAPAVAVAQSRRSGAATLRIFRSFSYWLLIMIGAPLAALISAALLAWTPGHGLRAEAISLALRLGAVLAVDLLLVCYLLALMTALVERSDADHSMPGGIPDASQPRTDEIP